MMILTLEVVTTPSSLGTLVSCGDYDQNWRLVTVSALPLVIVSVRPLKSETLRVNDRYPLFAVIIDPLVCTTSCRSVE